MITQTLPSRVRLQSPTSQTCHVLNIPPMGVGRWNRGRHGPVALGIQEAWLSVSPSPLFLIPLVEEQGFGNLWTQRWEPGREWGSCGD